MLELYASAATLTGWSEDLAELAGYGPVSAVTARDLATRPDITVVHLERLAVDAAA